MHRLNSDSYNDRLFSRGLRARLHLARFHWAQRISREIPHNSVLELGCFDGRLLDYIRPSRYVGLDAGWEGGIDLAIARHAGDDTRQFIKADDPTILKSLPSRSFDLGVALETLEHLPSDKLDLYLAEVARLCDHFLVTVPNEKGPVFLAKWLVKRIALRDDDAHRYTVVEVLNATLGRMHLVRRDEHKGFDYAALATKLSERFDVLSVVGLPLGPPLLAFSVGLIAKTRHPTSQSLAA